jgi:medium-chain acyl-[acyl-carrier-protein] hydrolase
VCSIQPPGREHRITEKRFARFDDYAEDLTKALTPWLDLPCAFFGHSLGALTAFECARRLRLQSQAGPVVLFASGCRAPQIPIREKRLHDLPDDLFLAELRNLNGTPREAFEHPELMALLLPIVRADFAVYESYEYRPGEPLQCPIHALGGVGDERVTRADLAGWSTQSTGAFSLRMFPGDHFFLYPAQRAIVQAIGAELEGRHMNGQR